MRLQILLLQIKMLKSRIKTARIVATPEEKSELLRLGALLDHNLNGVLQIVQPETYHKWRRQSAAGVPAKPLGRKGLVQEVRDLIVRLARENYLWGHRRIVGELLKLGHVVAPSSVKRVMQNSGIEPTPKKSGSAPPSDWTQFVHAHMETLIACDFFTKPVYTLLGRFDAYVLIWIHLGTRKVYCSPATRNPDNAWVVQQARNASMWLAGEGERAEMLIHDADTKFSAEFKRVWEGEGVECKQTIYRAPKQNSFAENFIGTIKREWLNHFLCFSLDQLDYINRTWLNHYHTARPHRGFDIGNRVLDDQFKPQREGPVLCREKLGGLIKEYYREAA